MLRFQGDEIFTFWFNLITTDEGEKGNYTLNKTCRLALPWAPREVTCESNYMEVRCTILINVSKISLMAASPQVSIITDVTCPTKTTREDWDSAIQTVSCASPTITQRVLITKHSSCLNVSRPTPLPTPSGS